MNKKQKSVKYIVPCIIIVVISIIISLVFVFNHTNTKEYDNKLEQKIYGYEDYYNPDYEPQRNRSKVVEEMDYEKAEATYLEAIKIDSKQSKAYLKLADIYVKQNKIDKFINILEKGIKNVDKDDRKKLEKKLSSVDNQKLTACMLKSLNHI